MSVSSWSGNHSLDCLPVHYGGRAAAARKRVPQGSQWSRPPLPPLAGRTATVSRQTKETKVSLSINLDGTGVAKVSSKIPFLDHMLDQIASHGLLDISLDADGDTWIDDHHTNEDIGLAFGTALAQALGDRKGIYRFGNFAGAGGGSGGGGVEGGVGRAGSLQLLFSAAAPY